MRTATALALLLLTACSDGPVLAGADAGSADGRLFVVRGGGQLRVYDDLRYPSQPAAPNLVAGYGGLVVSRDSRYLAWTSYTYTDFNLPAVYRLYTYDRHTGSLRQLLPEGFAAANPSWTADGHLAYLRTDQAGDGVTRLVSSAADGSALRQLLPDADTLGRSPEISPDGRRVVWVTDEFTPRLAVVDLASGSRTLLTDADSASSYTLRDPTWSPDGRRVAVIRIDYAYPAPNVGMLQVVDLGGAVADEHAVTGYSSRPAWSPDGHRLAYCRYAGAPDYGVEVRVFRIGSEAEVTITPSLVSECGPTWGR